jgi:DNA repair protein RadC
MGPAKVSELKAAFEMGRRMARPKANGSVSMRAGAIHELLARCRPFRTNRSGSCCWTPGTVSWRRKISRGSLNESIAHPREVFKPAIAKGAYAVAVVHNHPRGIPSRAS